MALKLVPKPHYDFDLIFSPEKRAESEADCERMHRWMYSKYPHLNNERTIQRDDLGPDRLECLACIKFYKSHPDSPMGCDQCWSDECDITNAVHEWCSMSKEERAKW